MGTSLWFTVSMVREPTAVWIEKCKIKGSSAHWKYFNISRGYIHISFGKEAGFKILQKIDAVRILMIERLSYLLNHLSKRFSTFVPSLYFQWAARPFRLIRSFALYEFALQPIFLWGPIIVVCSASYPFVRRALPSREAFLLRACIHR